MLYRRHLMRAALLALLWWLLAGPEFASWVIGVPTIALILVWQAAEPVSIGRVQLVGFLRFVPYFLWRSFLGACDVAWRTLHPRLPIEPMIRPYSLRLPAEGPARVVLANTISLLPGTATAALDRDMLQVHLLTGSPEVFAGIGELEQRVADLFGHELGDESGKESP